MMEPSSEKATWYRRSGKRMVDLVGSLTLIIVLSPLLIASAAAVWVAMGSPVLFRQRRAGRGGRQFTLLKFRTMLGDDHSGIPAEDRLTRFGRILRRTSLDELPELWHVMRGQMSLVGPRPLLIRYNDRYSSEQARRLTVRPGITGWAQINGRNDTTWTKRLEYDVWYVDNLSLSLDVKILLMTLPAVVRGSGVMSQDGTLMPEFVGEAEKRPQIDREADGI